MTHTFDPNRSANASLSRHCKTSRLNFDCANTSSIVSCRFFNARHVGLLQEGRTTLLHDLRERVQMDAVVGQARTRGMRKGPAARLSCMWHEDPAQVDAEEAPDQRSPLV